MDGLKWSLGPDGVNLLTDQCLSVYLDDFDLLNAECFKPTLAKALGLAIIAGTNILLIPQIMNLVTSKSAEGLSLFSVVLELLPW